MADFRKTRVLLTAVYRNGDVLRQDHAVPARVSVQPIPGAGKFRELSLRLVVTPEISEELLEGICAGTVSMNIEQMPTAVDREVQS